jgi:hypothetical protein
MFPHIELTKINQKINQLKLTKELTQKLTKLLLINIIKPSW